MWKSLKSENSSDSALLASPIDAEKISRDDITALYNTAYESSRTK